MFPKPLTISAQGGSASGGNHSPFTNARRAFTLIELLVVITIIAILAGVSAAAFNSFNRSQRLAQGAKELETVLKEAQSRALSSVGGLNWGVHLVIGQDTARIFSSTSYSYNAATAIPRRIGEGVIVSSTTLLESPVNVVFSVSNGSVVFITDTGSCRGGSKDSGCAWVGRYCLAIEVNLQGTTDKRYLKVNERNIFESDALTPCP